MKNLGLLVLIGALGGCTGDATGNSTEVPMTHADMGMDGNVEPDLNETDQAQNPVDLGPDSMADAELDSEQDLPITPPPACTLITLPSPDWIVAPNGTASGAGTVANPLSLQRALSAEGPVRPGDRVELLGGTYSGNFVSQVAGTSAAPIVFAAKKGERVILDSNIGGDAEDGFIIQGRWTEFHGFEITNSNTDRPNKPGGVGIYGPDTKLINSAIYDTSQGISFWTPAVNSELYGNFIYNNGFEGPTRGHGHAIYTQNLQGTKRIANNIIFFGFAYGIHAYTEGGSIQGFDIENNVWFRTGASRPGASQTGTSEGCLVGGLKPVARARLIGNHSWGPSTDARSALVGWGGQVQNEDITFLNNYLVGRVQAQGMWQTGTLENNVFHSQLNGIAPADYPNNTFSTELPTGTKVVVQKNQYDAGRLDLVIYNWPNQNSVSVDLSAHLAEDSPFEIYSVFDLWGTPVLSGVYSGGSVNIPMGSKAPVQPVGAPDAITGADDPGKTFGVFVLRTPCALD